MLSGRITLGLTGVFEGLTLQIQPDTRYINIKVAKFNKIQDIPSSRLLEDVEDHQLRETHIMSWVTGFLSSDGTKNAIERAQILKEK